MTSYALITGASGGIGLDFVHKFAANGYSVILVARSQDKLEQIAADVTARYGVTAMVLPMDLADPDAPQALYDELQRERVRVDVLVNNAGFAMYGYFHELEMARTLQMLQLNIVTLTHLTRLILPDMVARGAGKILNVASTAAFQPGPLMAAYYASKAYVLHFSEAIADEVKDKGVTVTALAPGPTESGFQARANMEDSRLVQDGLMAGKRVVDEGYAALMAGKRVVVPGLRNQALTLLPRLLPRKWVTSAVRNAQARIER